MCTSREYTLSPNLANPASFAWLNTEFVGGGGIATDGFPLAVDFTGHAGSVFQMNCRTWDSNSDTHRGLGVDFNGRIDTFQCNGFLPVTCCRPVP